MGGGEPASAVPQRWRNFTHPPHSERCPTKMRLARSGRSPTRKGDAQQPVQPRSWGAWSGGQARILSRSRRGLGRAIRFEEAFNGSRMLPNAMRATRACPRACRVRRWPSKDGDASSRETGRVPAAARRTPALVAPVHRGRRRGASPPRRAANPRAPQTRGAGKNCRMCRSLPHELQPEVRAPPPTAIFAQPVSPRGDMAPEMMRSRGRSRAGPTPRRAEPWQGVEPARASRRSASASLLAQSSSIRVSAERVGHRKCLDAHENRGDDTRSGLAVGWCTIDESALARAVSCSGWRVVGRVG